MQLKNDVDGRNALRDVIESFYKETGRVVRIFLETEEQNFFKVHFFLERRHVIRYGIGMDRRMWLGGLELGIGPQYFSPYYFWDYPNSERFKIEASTEAVVHNLALLDEFLGYANK